MVRRLCFMLPLLVLASVCAAHGEFVRTFTRYGRAYEVRAIETGERDVAWPEALVMRWRPVSGGAWREVARVDGVRTEKPARLRDARGRGIDALVVSSPGGSAQFISVVQVKRDPPGLKLLLDGELDKGSFDYRYDNHGRLTGFLFHYCRWHVGPNGPGVRGHVLSARRLRWDPARRRFQHGAFYIDRQAESQATLLGLLETPGSSEYLGVRDMADSESDRHVLYYHPIGILRAKTPPSLRSSKWVRATIEYGKSPESEPRLVELRPVAGLPKSLSAQPK